MATTNLQILESINKKIDDLIAALPNTYVTIRSHELQIKAHEEKINNTNKRLDALEQVMQTTGKWSLDQHDSMRKEWTGEVKDVNTKLDSVETSVIKLIEQSGHQTKILTWVLGVFTAIMIALIIAYLTHHLSL